MLFIKILWGLAIATMLAYSLVIAGMALKERFQNLLLTLGQGFHRGTFRQLHMWKRIGQHLEKVCGFKCRPLARHGIIGLLLVLMIGAVCLTFLTTNLMPATAVLAMVAGFLLVLFLCVDSLYYYFDLFHSSPREVLPLARSIDPFISRAIGVAEEYVKGLDSATLKEEIASQAREITADFETRPPYPRITALLFKRAIFNFVLTIFCFAIVTPALAYTEKYFGAEKPAFKHDCTLEGNPWRVAVHSLYFHSVVFQGLGDAEHAPQTILAQTITTGETFIACFYFILILGGIYNTATIVRDNLTPAIFRESLASYLTSLCGRKLTVSKEDLEETKQ